MKLKLHYSSIGVYLSSKLLEFKSSSYDTKQIVSNFEGETFRIAKHKTREESLTQVMIEVQNDLITLVLCQDLESPSICGRKLCWNSDEKVLILDIDELILLYKQGKEDEDNFFDFDSISQKVAVKEKEHGKLSKL